MARKWKGPRENITSRVSETLAAAIRNKAAELDMTVGDVVATGMAEWLGMPEQAPRSAVDRTSVPLLDPLEAHISPG